jgi:hypothetical protein
MALECLHNPQSSTNTFTAVASQPGYSSYVTRKSVSIESDADTMCVSSVFRPALLGWDERYGIDILGPTRHWSIFSSGSRFSWPFAWLRGRLRKLAIDQKWPKDAVNALVEILQGRCVSTRE